MINKFDNAVVYFKDGHKEQCIFIKPYDSDNCEFCTQSGLYFVCGEVFYKYHLDFLKMDMSLNGFCTYDDGDCYLVEDSIDRVECKLEEEAND